MNRSGREFNKIQYDHDECIPNDIKEIIERQLRV